jgi:hypothetical protein
MDKDRASCHGVTLFTQDPSYISTDSSDMIGISLFMIGIMTVCHINFLYLLSFGFTATATSPKIVSRCVVAICNAIHFDQIKYFRVYSTTFFLFSFMLVFWKFVCNALLQKMVSFCVNIFFS